MFSQGHLLWIGISAALIAVPLIVLALIALIVWLIVRHFKRVTQI